MATSPELSKVRSVAGRAGGKAPHKKYIRGIAAMPKWKRNKISKLGVEARNAEAK